VTLDLLFDSVELIRQSLAGIVLLHGEDTFKGLLLAAENLDLLLVGAQLLLECVHRIIQVIQLSLQMGSVVETDLGLLSIIADGPGAQSHIAEFLLGRVADLVDARQRFPCERSCI